MRLEPNSGCCVELVLHNATDSAFLGERCANIHLARPPKTVGVMPRILTGRCLNGQLSPNAQRPSR